MIWLVVSLVVVPVAVVVSPLVPPTMRVRPSQSIVVRAVMLWYVKVLLKIEKVPHLKLMLLVSQSVQLMLQFAVVCPVCEDNVAGDDMKPGKEPVVDTETTGEAKSRAPPTVLATVLSPSTYCRCTLKKTKVRNNRIVKGQKTAPYVDHATKGKDLKCEDVRESHCRIPSCIILSTLGLA